MRLVIVEGFIAPLKVTAIFLLRATPVSPFLGYVKLTVGTVVPQTETSVLVNVTAAFAKACPSKLPRVTVMDVPARILPMKTESVSVAASAVHQNTLLLHASPAGHGHREVGARESAGPAGPNFENPDIVRGPVERQHAARLGHRRVKTIDAWRERLSTQRLTSQVDDALLEASCVVRGEEVIVSLLGDRVALVDRPRDRAIGLSDRTAEVDAHVSDDNGVGCGHRRATQDREVRRRTQIWRVLSQCRAERRRGKKRGERTMTTSLDVSMVNVCIRTIRFFIVCLLKVKVFIGFLLTI